MNQNGLFEKAVVEYKANRRDPELVRVYEKIMPGIWSLKGVFSLIDCYVVNDGHRNVFRFIMELSKSQKINIESSSLIMSTSRVIPTEVKKEVWKRDMGKCVKCGSGENLHFDHDLPYSKGGTSLTAKNVRLLCMKHNLEKSAKIE
jgi:5-methylcytosine-specific restriction endonuclease McrA